MSRQLSIYVVAKRLYDDNMTILRAFSELPPAKDYATKMLNRYKAKRIDCKSVDIFEVELD